MLVNKCDLRNYFFVINYKKVMLSKKMSISNNICDGSNVNGLCVNVLLFFVSSYRADVNSTLLPKHIWGRRNWSLLYIETCERIIPYNLHHIRLRSSHDGHSSRETNVYKGKDCNARGQGKSWFRERVGSGKELVRGKSWFGERVGLGKELVQGKSWFRETVGSGKQLVQGNSWFRETVCSYIILIPEFFI